MMGALHKGLPDGYSIAATYDDEAVGNFLCQGYIPNPGGLWEVGYDHYTSAVALRNLPDNLLMKVFFDGLTNLPKNDYLIIFMERDEREMVASLQQVDKHFQRINWTEAAKPESDKTFDVYRPYCQQDIDHVQDIMGERRDVTLLRVNFKDLINNPAKVFQRIKYTPLGKLRLSISIEEAVSFIKPEYYRSKLDDDSTSRRKVRATHS
jgi:hypothetical protein